MKFGMNVMPQQTIATSRFLIFLPIQGPEMMYGNRSSKLMQLLLGLKFFYNVKNNMAAARNPYLVLGLMVIGAVYVKHGKTRNH
jgi:hypothetical protein